MIYITDIPHYFIESARNLKLEYCFAVHPVQLNDNYVRICQWFALGSPMTARFLAHFDDCDHQLTAGTIISHVDGTDNWPFEYCGQFSLTNDDSTFDGWLFHNKEASGAFKGIYMYMRIEGRTVSFTKTIVPLKLIDLEVRPYDNNDHGIDIHALWCCQSSFCRQHLFFNKELTQLFQQRSPATQFQHFFNTKC